MNQMLEVEAAGSSGVWASGEAYEPYMGRWSRVVAHEFVKWLEVPRGSSWLDVGTGTGAIVGALLERAEPRAVIALDRSEGYLQYARERCADALGRVRWLSGDACRLPLPSGDVDVAVSGLMLNFLSDAASAVRELSRVTRPGGTAAAYVWDYGSGMEILRLFWDVAAALDPSCADRDEARRSENWRPERLASLFCEAELGDVITAPIDVTAQFASSELYWRPFLGGQGTVASYVMELSEERREGLRRALFERLPRDAAGGVSLRVRAWAVRGRKAQGGAA